MHPFWQSFRFGFGISLGIVLGIAALLIIAGAIALGVTLLLRRKKDEATFEIHDWAAEKLRNKRSLFEIIKRKEKTKRPKLQKTVYVIDFEGDIRASQTKSLREQLDLVLDARRDGDQVVLRLKSPGGMVSGYGHAASQLSRLRQANLPLTICIDEVAASGGYLMACVANRILAAPFAIVGSIGVISGVLNVRDVIERLGARYFEMTAGQRKRNLTMLGEPTEEKREHAEAQLAAIHAAFKDHVARYRPQVNLQEVATGDWWLAVDGLRLQLVDELKVSDDLLRELAAEHNVLELRAKAKKAWWKQLLG